MATVLNENTSASAATKQEAPLAFYLPDLRGAGVESVTLTLTSAYAAMGHNIHLVVENARGEFRERVPETVKIVELGAGRTLGAIPKLVNYLRREQPRMLVSALVHTSLVCIWAKLLAGVDTKILIVTHNTQSTVYKKASGRKRFEVPLMRMFYKYAYRIIAVSRGVADDLAQLIGFDRSKIDVVYNPIISDELLRKAELPVDHPWLVPGEPPVILNVGRLTPQKDQAMLVRAFAKVRESMPARLLILGQGPEREALEALTKELGVVDDVSMPGFADNPFAYMSKCAVFALSSRNEGMPAVIIEALACGTRVVSTACPSGPDEILADGKYGKLVPVGDVDAMARAIIDTLKDPGSKPPAESWAPHANRVCLKNYEKVLELA